MELFDFNDAYINSMNVPELVKAVAVQLFMYEMDGGPLAIETRKQLESLANNGIHTLVNN